MEKPQMMKAVLTVKEKIYLTPHYIRVILEGEDLSIYEAANVGDNNKIVIPKDKLQKIQLPDGPPKGASDFYIRTYTMRYLDVNKNEMAIDFVMHGETGPASSWAIHAEKGDELGVLMKAKRKPIVQPADWYLLIGDHTALPVISTILENLPATTKGKVLLEVHSSEDVILLQKPAGVEIKWIFNSNPGETAPLLEAFQTEEIPDMESKFVYAAAEYHTIKEIQESLRSNPKLERKDWYAFSYWKYGIAEDASAMERRAISK
ncbi:NADPH-dependent ferric siderophore reductase, contains FAD-binding and SIP domains [Pustulibacterium marinum]|uniref:NADPH-dependent ferric siderophore reductase, contains FAD-binding and SIP domains n=1 Tax=Pustulibacterium marinum TaxID=1224947 RepID=A0A1I7IT22_9FLAO|nr:siderophore-interacting protein [Pustulibacterium marinum]SFU76085.1 NADPH-dependent ferric siderophore reductase, contains FAD-binding and SIP domains [Pustulibacterium marinum]